MSSSKAMPPASENKSLMPRNLAIIGSTGSIGTQTLEIVRRCPGRYRIAVLAAGSRVDNLIAQAREFRPSLAIIARPELYPMLRTALEPLGIETASGPEALADAMTRPDVDMVVTATVGYSGLAPTLAAIKAGKDIALANKETMVVAGELVTELLKQSKSRIYPVDSEHSAIFQCLRGEDSADVSRLIITASGGPFRTWPAERMALAKASDALRHPNWTMGAKITIDSATLVNKAFEIIEARWLFGIEPSRIEAIIHPQSIIHSMVEFADGAIKAQMGLPSMLLPIAYALGEATRLPGSEDFCSLLTHSSLTFEQPDESRFPGITLSKTVLEAGGNMGAIVNAANEVAVAAFLRDRIGFPQIVETIFETIPKVDFIADASYSDYVETNKESRIKAEEIVKNKSNINPR